MSGQEHSLTPLRTMLFVPGDRPDRIAKAVLSHADSVVVDLEDAVAADRKASAREGAIAGLRAAHADAPLLAVRLNALATGLLNDDLAALAEVWPRIGLIVLPMVPDAAAVREVSKRMARIDRLARLQGPGPVLIPLVETATAVLNAREIAAADARVHTLAFGPADLSSEIGVTPSATGDELRYARSMIVLAAVSAGLRRPIDGPWLRLSDSDGLRVSAIEARRLGFSGKQVIHPEQIAVVQESFAVSEAEVAQASIVVAAFAEAQARGSASIRLPDGTFVDYAVAKSSQRILDGT